MYLDLSITTKPGVDTRSTPGGATVTANPIGDKTQ